MNIGGLMQANLWPIGGNAFVQNMCIIMWKFDIICGPLVGHFGAGNSLYCCSHMNDFMDCVHSYFVTA